MDYRADPTDVLARRIGAYVIDTLIGLIIIFAVAVPVFSSEVDRIPIRGRSDICSDYRDDNDGSFCVESGDIAYVLTANEMSGVGRAFYGAAIGWTVLNAILLQGITGGTVGKLLLGLRVLRFNGRRAGFGWCTVRTVILVFVDALCFVIGLVVALTSAGHRRVGDIVASTVVVPKEYEGHPIVVPGLTGYPMPSDGYREPVSTGASQSFGEGPTWDPARNAYIQYDRPRSAWLQWDDASKQWNPIDEA